MSCDLCGMDCPPYACEFDRPRPPEQPYPEPCQGCSMITDAMTDCLDLCHGMSSEADLIERAAKWHAEQEATPVPVAAVGTHDTTGGRR